MSLPKIWLFKGMYSTVGLPWYLSSFVRVGCLIKSPLFCFGVVLSCIQLYCDCFSSGIYCNAYCSCSGCTNDGSIQNQIKRNRAILACLERNPHSFRPGQGSGLETPTPSVALFQQSERPPVAGIKTFKKSETPCNCTKSRCLKVGQCGVVSSLCLTH